MYIYIYIYFFFIFFYFFFLVLSCLFLCELFTRLLLYFNFVPLCLLCRQERKVDKIGSTPLCMKQFTGLFACCKIPGKDIDFLKAIFQTGIFSHTMLFIIFAEITSEVKQKKLHHQKEHIECLDLIGTLLLLFYLDNGNSFHGYI